MRFAHRLALAMHEPDVELLLSRITNRKLLRWMSFYQLEPWGDHRADLRSAIVACTVANSAPRKRGSKRFKPSDFMPYVTKQRRSPEDNWKMLSAFFLDRMKKK